MTRGLGIVGAAFIVALGLMTPTGRASAQNQVFGCANLKSGSIKVVASNASCGNNEQSIVLGGALAGADYQCVQGTVAPGAAYTFTPSSPSASFGSAISPTTGQFSSVGLQQGIYQIHLSGYGFFLQQPSSLSPVIEPILDMKPDISSWLLLQTPVGSNNQVFEILGGERLLSVGSNNSILQFLHIPPSNQSQAITSGNCELVITKLQ
jgi:hypothetical protein